MHTLEAIGSINKERFSRACFGRCQSDGGSLRVAGVDRLDDEASSLHSDGVQIRGIILYVHVLSGDRINELTGSQQVEPRQQSMCKQ
jgi:hypothetical protein